jgi:DNA-binding LacI/PurR family transcriptional regulator
MGNEGEGKMESGVPARTQGGRSVTIYDVAEAAGVSHQTVANVLRSPDRVSAKTRSLVEQHIAELGFRPNRMAQNLSAQKSRLIGYRIPQRSLLADGGILDSFLHAFAEAAEEVDHHVVLFHSQPGLHEAEKAAELYRTNVADAFVVAETEPGDPRVAAFAENRLRFVSFGRTDSTVPHSWVDTDNVAGSRMAAEHLIGLGHRQIGFLGWPGPSLVGADRMEGWRYAMRAAGLNADDNVVARTHNSRSAAAAACEELFVAQPALTAIVASSDELALGVQAAARRLGRLISVVGYDDSPLATAGDGLTTVRQPMAEIARRIVSTVAQLVGDGLAAPVHERVLPELIVRGSTLRLG